VSAPVTTLALLDYVMQPPPEGDEPPDTARVPKEQNLPPAGEQPQNNKPITDFAQPDTARHGDVNQSFPGVNPAALETLGPASAVNRPITPVAASASPAVRARGGILGIHPLALLVGLIALHIFIVTKVVK